MLGAEGTTGDLTDAELTKLPIKVVRDGPASGTVKITYWVLIDPDGGLEADTTDEEHKWVMDSRTLSVTVLASPEKEQKP